MLSYQLLDQTLNVLKLTTSICPQSDWDIFQNLPFLQGQNNNRNRRAIIDKLKRDGYIDCIISAPPLHPYPSGILLYFITFDGLILLEIENGYEGRIEKQIEEEKRNQKQDEKISSLTQQQTKASWWMACAAIVALVFSATALFLSYKDYRLQEKIIIRKDSQNVVHLNQPLSKSQLLKTIPIKK